MGTEFFPISTSVLSARYSALLLASPRYLALIPSFTVAIAAPHQFEQRDDVLFAQRRRSRGFQGEVDDLILFAA